MYYHLKISSEMVAGAVLIPEQVTYLDMSHNDLGKKPLGQIITICKAITPKVVAINASYNQLNLLPVDEFVEFIKCIPAHVEVIYLNHNALNTFTAEGLRTILLAFSNRLYYLGLGCNKLASYSLDDLIQIAAATPLTLSGLGLNGNEFYNLTSPALTRFIATFHDGIKVLDLSNNHLAAVGASGLVEVITALPKGINTLVLSQNQLHRFSTAELNTLCGSFPAHIHALHFDLGLPHGINFTVAGLMAILPLLPASIHHFNLSIDFTVLDAEDLAKILAIIPSTVLSFDLRTSNITKITPANLVKLKSCLAFIEIVYLNYKELLEISKSKCMQIAEIFPNVAEVVLCDSVNQKISNDLLAHGRACRALGFKAEIPSLKYHSAFFLKKSHRDYAKAALPAELKEFINEVDSARII